LHADELASQLMNCIHSWLTSSISHQCRHC